MINKNQQIKFGYQLTKIGVIPDVWEVTKLYSQIISIKSGVSVNSEDRKKNSNEYGILKTSSVSDGKFLPSKNKVISNANELERAKLNPQIGHLLISRMNTPDLVGACAFIPETRKDLFIPDRLWLTATKAASCNSQWLSYVLNTNYYKFQLKLRATGTSNTMKNISKESFLGMKIPLPPLQEQQKIAEILSSWEEAISKTQAVIKKLKKRNKGLAQQLLSGKKRLPGYKEEWKEKKLSSYFSERNETNFNDLPLLSVGELGVYPQTESNKKDSSNEDKSKYKRICPGDIGYNTMRMWQGRSALSALEGIVSPAYTIVTPKENASADFFAYLSITAKSGWLNYCMSFFTRFF